MIFRNLLRRKVRSLLTALGISIGVAAVVALGAIAEGMVSQITGMLTKGGADLTVIQSKVADIGLSAIDEEIGERIAAMPGVERVSGMIFSVVPAKGTPYFIVFGYDPNQYAIRHFKITSGAKLAASKQIIVGRVAANYLKKGVGDTIALYDMPYRIVGIYETGVGYEDGGGVITLKDAQALFKKPRQVSFFQIKLSDLARADEIRRTVERRYGDVTVSRSAEFMENRQDIQITRSIGWGISLLAIIVGGVGMMNTMLMSVMERTREVGVLRALGWSQWRILGMILQESLLLSGVGGLCGILLGVGIVQLIQLSPVGAALIQGAFSLGLFVQSLLVALILGAIGGLYPAYRASRLSPLEALRHE